MSNRTLQIGLLWHSVHSENLGVTALTFSNIAIIERVAAEHDIKVKFVILGWRDPGEPQLRAANLTVFPMRAKDLVRPDRLYAQCRACDLILDISAGDSFADIYGVRRFIFNALAKSAAVLSRRPLILPPQTVGPFGRWWTRQVAKALMRCCRVILTRDSLSTDYCRALGLKDVVEATDVAFMLPFDRQTRDAKAPVKVGINLSGLLFNGGYSRDNMFSLRTDYPVLARSLVSRFLAAGDCEVHLVSHVITDRSQVEDDYRVATLLAGEFPGVKVAPRFRTPVEAKSYISGLDFFCGSRMHACIAAFSSGVPVVPIAYSRKFAGLFGSLGYDAVTDCRTQTAPEIADVVLAGYQNRTALKRDVDRGREAAVRKLESYAGVLRTAMNAAADRAS